MPSAQGQQKPRLPPQHLEVAARTGPPGGLGWVSPLGPVVAVTPPNHKPPAWRTHNSCSRRCPGASKAAGHTSASRGCILPCLPTCPPCCGGRDRPERGGTPHSSCGHGQAEQDPPAAQRGGRTALGAHRLRLPGTGVSRRAGVWRATAHGRADEEQRPPAGQSDWMPNSQLPLQFSLPHSVLGRRDVPRRLFAASDACTAPVCCARTGAAEAAEAADAAPDIATGKYTAQQAELRWMPRGEAPAVKQPGPPASQSARVRIWCRAPDLQMGSPTLLLVLPPARPRCQRCQQGVDAVLA